MNIILLTWSLLLCVGVLMGGYVWLNMYEEMPLVEILSHHESELALPVYAQFTVTQRMYIEEEGDVTKLILPMYIPENAQPIVISLYKESNLMQRWRYPILDLDGKPVKTGVVDAELSFFPSTVLSGDLELYFDGSAISYGIREMAPRIFTESFDDAYPYGNYRIADNEKKGDVGLSLIARKTNKELVVEGDYGSLLSLSIQIARMLFFTLLIFAFPLIIFQEISLFYRFVYTRFFVQ